MNKFWFGLGFALAFGGATYAQGNAPAARLGLPNAPVVRGQGPELGPAGAFDIPKPMPKGSASEAPGNLPMPSGPAPSAGPIGGPSLPPGATIINGPVYSEPIGPGLPPPVPGGVPLDAGGYCPLPQQDTSAWYGGVDGLFWYMKSYSVPALVTVGPAGSGAFIGGAGTSILFGDNTIDTNPRYGGRLSLGKWLTQCWAVEFSAFYTQPEQTSDFISSTQYPDNDLARPFFSANRGSEFSELVGRPGVATGSVSIDSKSVFYGAELNARRKWWTGENARLDVLAGVRYLYLEEELRIEERVTGLAQAPPGFAGVSVVLTDSFKTKNRFLGGQVGAVFEYDYGRWTFTATGKVAAGISRQTVDISGTLFPVGGTGAAPDQPGALLALASNSGLRTRDTFAVVPEVGLNVGYDLTQNIRLQAGYSFLYWTSVARPGQQIDRTLNESSIPSFGSGAPASAAIRPQAKLASESVWAQGVNFGIQFRW